MKFYANLHTHSTHSDGKYSPATLARMAKEEGYGAVAVTDHDTVTGYEEIKAECDKLGLETVFGCEFSAPTDLYSNNGDYPADFHIMGFHFDPEHPEMKEYLAGMSLREADQTRILVERGLKEGLLKDITWDEVLEFNKGITWLCNEHVFRLMEAKGLAVKADYPAFFQTVFGPRRAEVPPCYPFKRDHEIIELIHAAGGIALVAHPHNQLQYIDALIEMGLDGLEACHFILTEEERAQALKIGLEKNLFISGGTDHEGYLGGSYESYPSPEASPYYAPFCTIGTTKAFFDEIKNKQLNR